MKKFSYILLFLSLFVNLKAQLIETRPGSTLDTIKYNVDTKNNQSNGGELEIQRYNIDGQVVNIMVTPDGDTLIMADLEDVSITSLREFESDADYLKYLKFKRYAAKVYPYAKEAIKIFREMEFATQNMRKRQRKKYIKELEAELEEQFEAPLKKLTKLQGKIMIKMIEKETEESMYDLLKGIKGRFAAFSYHNMGKLYSYDLKEGYQEGKYEILDAVLQDFNISYRMELEEKARIRQELIDKQKKRKKK